MSKITINTQIEKVFMLKITFLFWGLVISFLVLHFGHELWGGVIGLFILVVVAIALSEMNLMHPFMWFAPLFFLYSTSLPILVAFGERPYVQGLDFVLFLEWLALAAFIVVTGIPRKRSYKFNPMTFVNSKLILTGIYILSMALTLIYMLYVFGMGLTSKYAIASSGSVVRNLVPFFSIYILSFTMLTTYYLSVLKKVPKKLILITIIYTLGALMILGERDYLLRVFLGAVFLYHVLVKPISKKMIVAIASLVLLSIPLLGNMKNAAFGEREITQESSLIGEILGGEFITASRNLQNLIAHENLLWTRFNGETFLWDAKMILFQGMSPGAWYNQVFFPHLLNVGGGNGFTLVGEGYMNFGAIGVILLFSLLALFLKYLYKKTETSLVWLVIYISSIPIVIYSVRADFGTVLTQFSKHIVIPIVVIFVVRQVILGASGFKKSKVAKRLSA